MNKPVWLHRVITAVYVLVVTYMAGKWAVQSAYLERGYIAVGGEYIFIPMVAWVAEKAINLFFDALEDEHESRGNKETGSGDIAEMRDNR